MNRVCNFLDRNCDQNDRNFDQNDRNFKILKGGVHENERGHLLILYEKIVKTTHIEEHSVHIQIQKVATYDKDRKKKIYFIPCKSFRYYDL